MKQLKLLYLVAFFACFFVACDDDDDKDGDWGKAPEFPGVARVGAVSFTIGDVSYVGLGYNANRDKGQKEMTDFWKFKDGNWVKVDSFPGDGRFGGVAFVVGNKAYVGTGYYPTRNESVPNTDSTYTRVKKYFDDFWVFDGTTEKWEQTSTVAPYPGGGVRDAVAFSIGNYGYVGTGAVDGAEVRKDFYKYDPSSNTWTEIGFIGDSRKGASAFVIGDDAWVCLGQGSGYTYCNDVLKFNGSSQTWTACRALVNTSSRNYDNHYTEIPRAYAIAFVSSLQGKGDVRGYVACGEGTSQSKKVFEYSPSEDRWRERERIPNGMANQISAVSFVYKDMGYLTTGGSGNENAAYKSSWRFIPGIKEDNHNDATVWD